MGDAAPEDEIRAAGCVLWRRGSRGPEVALVHRTRYDDWSLPKGKRDPGEHVLQTAVREVAEETGIAVILGRRLRSSNYQQDGKRKIVNYWAARAAAAGTQAGFVPNDEVDLLDWLPVPAARARLTYPHDAAVLDDFASGPADTFPCILLRHAPAGRKDTWPVDDLARPLDEQGRRDAERLGALLGCYARGRVISAPALRCVATVRPYAALAGLAIEIEPAFTARLAAGAPPDLLLSARRRIEEVADGQAPAVVCAHRENLPLLIGWACVRLGAKVPDGPPLKKSSFWVLHIGGGMLVSAEHHHLLSGCGCGRAGAEAAMRRRDAG